MKALILLFDRDLGKLHNEIESFKSEEFLWKTEGNINNCAGNLCLHLIGNLNHFIGSVIGETGYVRKREAEFNAKNVPKNELLKMINETKEIVRSSLSVFETSLLEATYPIKVFGTDVTYEFFLIHLATHLNYHLGQINYLRRVLEK